MLTPLRLALLCLLVIVSAPFAKGGTLVVFGSEQFELYPDTPFVWVTVSAVITQADIDQYVALYYPDAGPGPLDLIPLPNGFSDTVFYEQVGDSAPQLQTDFFTVVISIDPNDLSAGAYFSSIGDSFGRLLIGPYIDPNTDLGDNCIEYCPRFLGDVYDPAAANASSFTEGYVYIPDTPEPNTFILLGTGVLASAGAIRRRVRVRVFR
jgi:hypothetical protein